MVELKISKKEIVEMERCKMNKICIICKEKYSEYGNNAMPITYGFCCDLCNATKVIPARLKFIKENIE